MLFHIYTYTNIHKKKENETHKNDKEKNIKKQFNYMFTFFCWFLPRMYDSSYIRTSSWLRETNIFPNACFWCFLSFFLLLLHTNTTTVALLIWTAKHRSRIAILLVYVCLFIRSQSSQKYTRTLSSYFLCIIIFLCISICVFSGCVAF